MVSAQAIFLPKYLNKFKNFNFVFVWPSNELHETSIFQNVHAAVNFLKIDFVSQINALPYNAKSIIHNFFQILKGINFAFMAERPLNKKKSLFIGLILKKA